jgi:arylsulfatase A
MRRIAVATVAAALVCGATRAQAPTHVVTIVCDDLGYGDLACYGHPFIKTPNLDRLASEGMLLTSCYSAMPVCSPSRAGFLTGRNPNRYGIHNWIPSGSGIYLPATEITAATHLKRAGYRTGHFGKWHLSSTMDGSEPTPGDHGFDYWFATQNNAAPSHENPTNFYRNGAAVGALSGYSCQLVASEAIAWLDGLPNRTTEPVYLNVWFHESHEPVESPANIVADYYMSATSDYDEAQYFANVTNMDQAVGRLLDALDAYGMSADTLVFFTSDNGPETLDRYPNADRSYGSPGPLRGMKLHMYEGGYRVPGIIRWPGMTRPGQVVDEPVSGLDVLPTLAEIAGVTLPADRAYDGASFLSIFDGRPVARAVPLFWRYDSAIGGPMDLSVRLGPWKLLSDPGRTFFELYNLDRDIGETLDLAAFEPDVLQQMVAIVNERHGAVLGDLADPANAPPTVSVTSPADGAQIAAGTDVLIQASASDADGSVSQVEFYRGLERTATLRAGPFETLWPDAPHGEYVLSAKATDDVGASSVSAGTDVTVGTVATVAATVPAAAEPGTDGEFTITRSGDVGGAATVAYVVDSSGTAAPGVDLVLSPWAEVSFAGGETTKQVQVQVVDDAEMEPLETVVVRLVGETACGAGEPSTATVTIADDDAGASLLAHWRLDETSRATAFDSVPPPYDGKVYGALMGRPGRIGGAYSFDGENDHVDTPFAGVGGTGARTVTAWVRTDSTATVQPIVAWGENVTSEKWHFRINDSAGDGTVGAIRAEVSNGYVIGSTVVTNNEWHMVAVAWADDGTPDITDAQLYVDGALETPSGSLPQAVNTNAAAATVQIGRRRDAPAAWEHFKGLLDDVRIYGAALSAVEIAGLHDEGTNEPPLVSVMGPAEGEVFSSGAALALVADASDPDGSVTAVSFYDGDAWIGAAVEGVPGTWELTWSGASDGTHVITAVAVDDGSVPGVTTSAPVNVTVGTVVTIAATVADAAEPSTDGEFTVTRSGDTSGTTTVDFVLDPDSTAAGGADFDLSPVSSVVFAPGETEATVAVLVAEDAEMEPDEAVVLRLAPGAGYVRGSPAAATVVIADGWTLLAHWRLDDTDGVTALDSVSGAYDGAVSGDVAVGLTGKVGGAFDFGGVDGHVDTPCPGVGGTEPRTVSAWVRTDVSTPNQPIAAWGENAASQKWHFRLNDNAGEGTAGAPRVEVNGGYVIGSTVVADGEWHMVTVTLKSDGTPNILDARLYVDGVPETPSGRSSQSVNTNTSSATVQIGRRQNSPSPWVYYVGMLDDVRLYVGALPAGDVALLYAETRGPVIGSQPADQDVLGGAPATFAVAATGTGALHYAWYRAGAPVGTDSDTYVIPSATLAMDGDAVHCVVSDDNANSWSRVATLTVTTERPVESVNTGAWVLKDTTGNVIGSTMLAYTDASGDTVTYTVKGLPAEGTLRLNGAALVLDDTFTQAEIDGDQLTYDAPAAAGGPHTFTFDVTDGVPDAAADVSAATFDITVAEVPPGLVAWWRLDEYPPSTTAADTAGANDGTLNGNPVWQPAGGRIGGALLFDGTGDFVQATGYKGITGTNPRTVSAWVRTTAANAGIVSWGSDIAGQKWVFRVQSTNGLDGATRIEVNGGYVVGNVAVNDGEWHHVAVTWEDDGTPNVTDAVLYVDGAPAGTRLCLIIR